MTKLNTITENQSDPSTEARVLDCFIEWATFIEETVNRAANDDDSEFSGQQQQTTTESLFSSSFINLCIRVR